jgi:hypothetical protein
MATPVSATFDGPEPAKRAVRALLNESVPRERIQVFLPNGADEREVALTQNNMVFRLSMIGGVIGTVIGLVALLLMVNGVVPMPGVGFSDATWLAIVQGSAFGLLLGWVTGVIIGLGAWTVDIEFPRDLGPTKVRVVVDPFVNRVDAVRETLTRLGGQLPST